MTLAELGRLIQSTKFSRHITLFTQASAFLSQQITNLTTERRSIETTDPADACLAINNSLPELLYATADSADRPQARHNDC